MVPSLIGLMSILTTIVMPVAIVFLLIWVYQIKKYNETQIVQNKEIIKLLEKRKTQ